MAYYISEKDGYKISTDPEELDVQVIHQYLSVDSYWAQEIPVDVVKKAIANSLCFGLYKNNNQIGFARLVTDKATFAYLADVFVLEEYRGQGLSKWLMEVIQSHPDVQGLRRWMLMTRDAQGLYEQFGWTVLDEDARTRCMQRHFKDRYRK
jgi:N-acetylglutamate synthase-like GNAT family acetyltransferase